MGLSMRTVSAAAGVTEEVALRYFRNRDSLFAAALRLPVDPVSAIPALMAPGIEGMGERLVRLTLETLRDPAARDDLMSLARTGVSAGQAVTGLQEFIEVGVVDRVAGMIGVPDARMRSALITSYLFGVATMRYGVRLEPLASASDEEVIRMVAPVIQDLLDPRHPIPGSTRARAQSRADAPNQPSSTRPGPRTRTFDPDPAATRAAEAARLAAMLAEADPTIGPSSTSSTSRSTSAEAATRGAAGRSTTKAATSSTNASTSTRTAAKRTAARAAAKVAPVTGEATPKPERAAPVKATASAKAAPKKATTPARASTTAARATKANPDPAKPTSRRSSSGGSRKATTSVAPGSDAAAGPRHAKVSADPAAPEVPSD
jgi:AcrR family transcriptional regulator